MLNLEANKYFFFQSNLDSHLQKNRQIFTAHKKKSMLQDFTLNYQMSKCRYNKKYTIAIEEDDF